MAYSLDQIQSNAEAALKAIVPAQQVDEKAVPDIKQVAFNANGSFDPFITYQFGDLQPWGPTSFTGPLGDDYVMPWRIQVTAPTMDLARRIGNQVLFGVLGQSFAWAGQVRKRVSGAIYPLHNSDGSSEAFIMPMSFGLVVQLETI